MCLKRKLQKLSLILKTYPLAPKFKGYGLRITGDIDIPENFLQNKNKEVLENWIHLASELSSHPPILFVTVSPLQKFLAVKDFVKSVDNQIIVGAHGYYHDHYHLTPKDDALKEIAQCQGYSEWFRFPYLDTNVRLTKIVSKYFSYDSSITSIRLCPFKIDGMWEYPVTPPTDTRFRDKELNDKIVSVYLKTIADSIQEKKFVTFLFHPNNFTINLMKALKLGFYELLSLR